MDFIESLIMAIFAKKAAKEIAKEFSDEHPVCKPRENPKATYHNLPEVYYNIEDFPPSLLGELFRHEPDFLDKTSGEDVRELLRIQATHHLHKGVLHTSETWFTISAQNRFVCKELLDSISELNYRDHNLTDFSNRLFAPVANPAQHSISIGEYTLFYKYALYYNLTLMLLIEADKEFLAGKRVSDKAIHYPKVRITDEIARKYSLTTDETVKTGVRFEAHSYAALDDFNSPNVHNQRTGWFELRIIDGTFRTDITTPYSFAEMRAAEPSVAAGNVWPSIIPGFVFDDRMYVSRVPFAFLESADELTILGSERNCELYVCRLKNGWGGIKFKLHSTVDYYRLAAWLIPVLSYYCSITRGWDYKSLISEYWPTYPMNDYKVD